MSSRSPRTWRVVGGGDKGGIVVRCGEDVQSELQKERLGFGAVVVEVELKQGESSGRLRFQKLCGSGPDSGWVSLKLTNGKDLLQLQPWPVLRVVGGAESGLVVREGTALTSQVLGRLAYGALVEERERVKERISGYELLQGDGPQGGWVSLFLQQKPLLSPAVPVADAVARFVASLRALSDAQVAEATAALAEFGDEERQRALGEIDKLLDEADCRLKRKALRLASTGPKTAAFVEALRKALLDDDATVRAEAAAAAGSAGVEEELLERAETDPDWRVRLFSARALSASSNVSARLAALAEAEGHGDVRRVLLGAPPGDVALGDAPTTTDGPLRVVALHGAASNSAIMKFQVRLLKKTLESRCDSEWFFLDSPVEWSPVPGATDPIFGDVTDFEKALAKGQALRTWYSHGNACYHGVDEGVENLLQLLKQRPIDVVISFSQASNLLSLALDALRRKGLPAPWGLSVMFSGGHIDDPIFQWPVEWTSRQPTLRVFNAAEDAFFHQGEGSLREMYPEILEFPHRDGHMFPHSEPRASEIYAQIAEEICQRCGKNGSSGGDFWRIFW
ncbi:unnamed protein product [Cladocopium goreaui]|uniref:Serine hydrolase domain-containing protein n=1 Tax=Cladocopium goreaui TaxID=2562237 RepID=A0A9P1CVC2_9DINO|nr:unnamed protein product [Cladocopium goreaui]